MSDGPVMNIIAGILLSIYVVVGVLVYIVLVSIPSAAGGNKLYAALAAVIWPLAIIYTFLSERL